MLKNEGTEKLPLKKWEFFSALEEFINRMIVGSDCCKSKFDGMRPAVEQIGSVCETIGSF